MPLPGPRLLALVAGLLLCAVAVWRLEAARAGITIAPLDVGTTPATVYRRADAPPAPAVIIAHGFAGSRQLMEAYALTLARAGYVAVTFDFEGHGRNPTPMRGDVTRIDGTTQFLKREIGRVTDAALALPSVDGRVALIGHSMASDIVVRRAREDPRVGATVAVSIFSEAVTKTEPRDLLMIDGAWERRLRAFAVDYARLADPGAAEGETIGNPARGDGRRAAVAPNVEHVGVLYSPAALLETRAWLDAAFGRESAGPPAATGGWIVLLLAGVALLVWPLAGLLPKGAPPPAPLRRRTFLFATLVPACLTPLLLAPIDTHVLPVLVADYLAAHLLVYGLLTIAILIASGVRIGRIAWAGALALAVWGVVVFGGAMDRYVASFTPSLARAPIIAALAAGAIPYMLSDSLVTEGGRTTFLRVIAARGAFLASLAAAVALDPGRLFFLALIIPLIILFFLIFGTMGGIVGRRTASAGAVGIGLGIVLAWSIGVAFPMFAG